MCVFALKTRETGYLVALTLTVDEIRPRFLLLLLMGGARKGGEWGGGGTRHNTINSSSPIMGRTQ